MGTDTMGRVLTEVTIENLEDLWAVRKGQLSPDQVRRITVDNALVDTGATPLALPTRMIQQLGLTKSYEKRATSSAGTRQVAVYEAVRLTIQGRYLTWTRWKCPMTYQVSCRCRSDAVSPSGNPVSPPIPNIGKNASAKSIGVVNRIDAP